MILEEQTRDIVKKIRMSSKEYKVVVENANSLKMNFSAYARMMLLKQAKMNPEYKRLLSKLITEVNYIGHNINQIVRNNNSGLYKKSDKEKLMELMRLINQKIDLLIKQNGD
jgi:hypothetical protein